MLGPVTKSAGIYGVYLVPLPVLGAVSYNVENVPATILGTVQVLVLVLPIENNCITIVQCTSS
jgi:hypothetical protein